MTHDGFIVRSSTVLRLPLVDHLQMPFAVHRADAPMRGAIHMTSGRIAIGKPKSAGDVPSQHSIAQLRLFGRARHRGTDQLCPLSMCSRAIWLVPWRWPGSRERPAQGPT